MLLCVNEIYERAVYAKSSVKEFMVFTRRKLYKSNRVLVRVDLKGENESKY